MPEARAGVPPRPDPLVQFLAKTQDGKIIAKDACPVVSMVQSGLSELLRTADGESLSQDLRTDLLFTCSRQLFAPVAGEDDASRASTPPEGTSASSGAARRSSRQLTGTSAATSSTSRPVFYPLPDMNLKLDSLSEEKKISAVTFQLRHDEQRSEDENFGISRVFGCPSLLRDLDHEVVKQLSPHLLGLCRMKTAKRPFNYSSCYSIGGSLLRKSTHGRRAIELHKQMLALEGDLDRILLGFVDSILEDIDYLKQKDNEFLILGFLFSPLSYVDSLTDKARGRIFKMAKSSADEAKSSAPSDRASASSSSSSTGANQLEFRWRTSQKHITVDYVKAHKRAFCAQMREHYYASGTKSNQPRKVLTFHFLLKGLNGRGGYSSPRGKGGGGGSPRRSGEASAAHATSSSEVIECSATFHLFHQNPETKSWGAYYSYPRWEPLLDGVFLSAKFVAGLAKGVSFKTKQKESGGGLFFSSAKKEDPDEKNKSPDELALLKLISYQLPKPSTEVEKCVMESAKRLAAEFEFVQFFGLLLRLHELKKDFGGSGSNPNTSESNFVADCQTVLANPLVRALYRARTSAQRLLAIGKRNHFAQHIWTGFRRSFRQLLRDVENSGSADHPPAVIAGAASLPGCDVSVYFLYPCLKRYLDYFEAQESIFSVSLDALRDTASLLQTSEWCSCLLLIQAFTPESVKKIDDYLAQEIDDSFALNSREGGSGQQSATALSKSVRYSFADFIRGLNPHIPTTPVDQNLAPAAVSRNFPPTVSSACQLFHYLTKQKLDATIAKAFKPLACARPAPTRRQWRAAFLRSYTVEVLKPVLLQQVYLNTARTKFLKDFLFTGVNEAYARRTRAKAGKKDEAKSPGSARSSVNFCGPHLFRGSYPPPPTPRIQQRVEAGGALGSIFVVTPAFPPSSAISSGSSSLYSPEQAPAAPHAYGPGGRPSSASSSRGHRYYLRQEDIHFHNLFVEKSNLEFLFQFARKINDAVLSPSTGGGGDAGGRGGKHHRVGGRRSMRGGDDDAEGGASSAASASGHDSPGGARSPTGSVLGRGTQTHTSIGPSGVAGTLVQGSGVFPNLLSLEIFVDCPEAPDANTKQAAFVAKVADIVTRMFEEDELFLPNSLVSQPGNKTSSLQAGEFSKDMLDAATESVWIDGCYFLPQNCLPRGLLDLKKKLAQRNSCSSFTEERYRSWLSKPRYVRLLVQVTSRLNATSPRYYLANTHPGLYVTEERLLEQERLARMFLDINSPHNSPGGMGMGGLPHPFAAGGRGDDVGSPAELVRQMQEMNAEKRMRGAAGNEVYDDAFLGGGGDFGRPGGPFSVGPGSPEPVMQLPGSLASPVSMRGSQAGFGGGLRGDSPQGGFEARNGNASRFDDHEVGNFSSGAASSSSRERSGSGASNGDPIQMRDVDVKTTDRMRTPPPRPQSGAAKDLAPPGVRPEDPDPFVPDFSSMLYSDCVVVDPRKDVIVDDRDVATILLQQEQAGDHGISHQQAPNNSILSPRGGGAARADPAELPARVSLEHRARPPTTLVKNLLFGVNPWSSPGFDALCDLARALHPLPDSFFLHQHVVPASPSRGTTATKVKWRTRTLSAHELRSVAKAKLQKILTLQDRVSGLFDSYLHTLKYTLLELDTILAVSEQSAGCNFAALQEMWANFVSTLRDDVLHCRYFVLPLFPEVQRNCIAHTVEQLDAFAIPTYDEDQLREWVRLARNCKTLLESVCVLSQCVWLHATVDESSSELGAKKKAGGGTNFTEVATPF